MCPPPPCNLLALPFSPILQGRPLPGARRRRAAAFFEESASEGDAEAEEAALAAAAAAAGRSRRRLRHNAAAAAAAAEEDVEQLLGGTEGLLLDNFGDPLVGARSGTRARARQQMGQAAAGQDEDESAGGDVSDLDAESSENPDGFINDESRWAGG